MDLIHGRLANTVMLYCLIIGAWGLWRFFRKQGVSSSYWGSVVIAELLVLIQGGLGIWLYAVGEAPARGAVHVLYGVVCAISLPAVYVYTRGRDERREMLLYGIVAIFVGVISIRAMLTGG